MEGRLKNTFLVDFNRKNYIIYEKVKRNKRIKRE